MFCDRRDERVFRLRAEHLVDDFPALEKQDRRNALDLELAQNRGVLIHIHFANLHLSCEVVGQLIDGGTEP